MMSLTKKHKTKNYFFPLHMRGLAKFEGLNSSLAHSSAEIFSCKNMCKLLDFSLRLPAQKVLKGLK